MAHRMALAADVAELGIFVRDEDRIGGEWNAQMYRLFRMDPAHGLPSQAQWLALVHPDDRERMARSRELILSQDAGFVEHEYRVQFADGEVRWMSQRARRETIDGRSVLFGIAADVTARVLNEQALRQAHERAALSARSVGMGAWEWDSANGISIWDDAMFRLRGIEPQPQVPDDELLAWVHPDDRDAVSVQLSAASRVLGPSACDFRVVWPDGTVRWLASRSMPLAVVDGHPTRCIGVNWDITEHVENQSVRSDKLLDKRESHTQTELVARISQELRTPLQAVIGFAQMLQHEFADPTARPRTRIDPIVTAGQQLLALINDLPDLSGLQADPPPLQTHPVGAAEVVREVPRNPLDTTHQRARLLYIEDNPVNAMLVQELVASHTLLDIVIEDNGTRGVARARDMRPELVLIDMQLPDFDGFEVLRRLKADPETAQLTCVALSANAVPAYIARAMAAGFDDYWTKPIDFNEFLDALEQLFPNAVHLTPLQ